MPVANFMQDYEKTPDRRPRWVGYLAAVALIVALTAILWLLASDMRGTRVAISYILAVMVVSYCYGLLPAVFSLGLSLLMFAYFFVAPVGHFPTMHRSFAEEGLIDLALGAVIVGAPTLLMRQSRHRIHRLAVELDRQKLLLESFAEHAPVAMGMIDRNSRYLIVNNALAQFSNSKVEDMVGKRVSEVAPPLVANHIEGVLEEILRTGEPIIHRGYTSPILSGRYFDIMNHPFRASTGEILGVIALVIETTEQVKAHWELKRNYERERLIAESLQSNLLGNIPEHIGNLKFETVYNAAFEEARVGGDFYDVFQLDDEKTGIVIGDVSGKGLNAAVQIAMAKYALRSQAYTHGQPSAVLREVNTMLVKEMDPESFVTLFFGVFDSKNSTLTYANAGHSPVILWKAEEEYAALIPPTGRLLGILDNALYEEKHVTLRMGDELLLGTDGLIEVPCGTGFMDIEKLLRIYTELRASDQPSAAALIDRVLGLCKGNLRDDLAILRIWVTE